jgi:hypothetical protein
MTGDIDRLLYRLLRCRNRNPVNRVRCERWLWHRRGEHR